MQRTRKILSLQATENISENTIFQAVCEDIHERVDADLTSIWFFNSSKSTLKRQCQYDALEGNFDKGHIITKAEYPGYFETILEDNYLTAPDVHSHYGTKALSETYFDPKGIKSLLDFIIHRDFQPIGVICCENRRSQRNWNESDKNYLRSIASLVSVRFRYSRSS
jgi:GAF domain-containing protein